MVYDYNDIQYIKFIEFLKENNAYDSFLFYMKNDEKKMFKDIKELLLSGAYEAVSFAFEWDKTPTEEFWYQLDKKWKNQVLGELIGNEKTKVLSVQ